MGLLTIIKKIKQKEKELRILVLYEFVFKSFKLLLIVIIVNTIRGLDNSGKTTILKKLNGEDVDSISPTLGFSISTFEHKKLDKLSDF